MKELSNIGENEERQVLESDFKFYEIVDNSFINTYLSLKPNKRYNLQELICCDIDYSYKLSLPNGIYGENKTRIKHKSIELNGIIIRNVDNIIIECVDGMLWFNCVDVNKNIVASKSIKRNERLIIKETSLKTYEYILVKDVA